MGPRNLVIALLMVFLSANSLSAQEASDQSVVEMATELSKEGYKEFTLEGDWLGRKFLIGMKDGEQIKITLDKAGHPIDAQFLEDFEGDGKFEKSLGDEHIKGIKRAEKAISRLSVSDEIKSKIFLKFKKAISISSNSSETNRVSTSDSGSKPKAKAKADSGSKPKAKAKADSGKKKK